MTTPDPALRASRRQFLIILAIFALPPLAAAALYFLFPGLRPSGTTNYGALEPVARPLPAFSLVDASGKPADAGLFKGKWSMVYIAPADCAETCRQRVYHSRQVRSALDRNARRLQRVYIAPDAPALAAAQALLAREHPDLVMVADTRPFNLGVRSFFNPFLPGAYVNPLPDWEESLYMVDPLGNWFMTYPPKPDPVADFKGILKDLKKLMNQSQVD